MCPNQSNFGIMGPKPPHFGSARIFLLVLLFSTVKHSYRHSIGRISRLVSGSRAEQSRAESEAFVMHWWLSCALPLLSLSVPPFIVTVGVSMPKKYNWYVRWGGRKRAWLKLLCGVVKNRYRDWLVGAIITLCCYCNSLQLLFSKCPYLPELKVDFFSNYFKTDFYVQFCG